MTHGFIRADGEFQEQCPCCGKFPSPDDGFYMFCEGYDYISLFCAEACARRWQMKGGKFVDGDGDPYEPKWE
jgi:hypothetical protein